MEKAQKGDLIRVVDAVAAGSLYAIGEILEVTGRGGCNDHGVYIEGRDDVFMYDREYVIHRKVGEEDSDVIKTEITGFHGNPIPITLRKGEKVITSEQAEQDTIVVGVGPDAPIVTNEVGAKQSHSPYRMDLIDAKALLKIAQVHKQGGDKYGDTNWRGISVNDHINHALVHVYAYLAGDTSDEHISHAATRLIFALALELDAKSTQD